MSDDTVLFFNLLFGRQLDGHGHLVINTFPGGRPCFFPNTTDGRSQAAAHALQLGAQADVYFGCGLMPNLTGTPSKSGTGQTRGTEADVQALPGLWIDIDIVGPHKKGNLPPTVEEAKALAVDLFVTRNSDGSDNRDFTPTLIIHSGWGLHAYWLWDEPWLLTSALERNRARDLQRSLQQIVRDECATKGWWLDDTSDLTRVLRPPGTWNRKPEAPEVRDVTILDYQGPFHNLARWGALPPVVGVAAPKVRQEAPDFELPPPRTLGEGQDILAYIRDRMLKLTKDAEDLKAVQALVAGKAYAVKGDRNNKSYALASMAAWYALDVRHDVQSVDLLPLFEASLAAMLAEEPDPRNPPPSEEDLERQLNSAISSVMEKKAGIWAVDKAFKSGLLKRALEGQNNPQWAERLKGRTDEELINGYTQEDLAFFARTHNCTVQEFLQRMIIQAGGSSLYVFATGGRYLPAVQYKQGLLTMRREMLMAPIEWECPKADGDGFRKKKLDEILDEHGTAAVKVQADLYRQESCYESSTRTFHEAVCPLRNLEPRFDPQIALWLEELVDDQVRDKFLDWIASITRLDWPSCALYLKGPRGVGKGLFADGLAKLWSPSGTPTELATILNGFNEALTNCPLILADEKLPEKQGLSGILRSLIAATSRNLSRKYQPSATLSGAVRLLLTGNNDDMLADLRENLTHEDLEAVAQRFFYVRTRADRAARYLESIGGRAATQDWVAGDLLARHALWLRDNRQVKPGSRFFVEGTLTQVHRDLVTNVGPAAAVCDWLTNYLERSNLIAQQAGDLILVGNGHFLVNTKALTDFWDSYVHYGRPPSTLVISRQLANLSYGLMRPNFQKGSAHRRRYYDLRLEHVFDFVQRSAIGDADVFAEQIRKPNAAWAPAPTVRGEDL